MLMTMLYIENVEAYTSLVRVMCVCVCVYTLGINERDYIVHICINKVLEGFKTGNYDQRCLLVALTCDDHVSMQYWQ